MATSTITNKQRYVLQGIIDGKTYAEIGRELGITRQAAHQYAKNAIKVRGGVVTAKYYPNLVRYIRESEITCRALSVKAGVSPNLVADFVARGRTPSWQTIQKLCAVTGLGVEELMVREADENKGEVELWEE